MAAAATGGLFMILMTMTNNKHTTTDDNNQDDRFNYALLIALYTLQGIPMGLSASIPFLIQQMVQSLAAATAGDDYCY